jgi:hypothetical protein
LGSGLWFVDGDRRGDRWGRRPKVHVPTGGAIFEITVRLRVRHDCHRRGDGRLSAEYAQRSGLPAMKDEIEGAIANVIWQHS